MARSQISTHLLLEMARNVTFAVCFCQGSAVDLSSLRTSSVGHARRNLRAYCARLLDKLNRMKLQFARTCRCKLRTLPPLFSRFLKKRASATKAIAVFTGNDERLDHFCLFKVAVELVQLVQPELITSRIRVAPQVTKVFHHHKHLVALGVYETLVARYLSQHPGKCATRPLHNGENRQCLILISSNSFRLGFLSLLL